MEVPITTPHHTFKGIKSKWFGKLLSEKRQCYQTQKKKKKSLTSHDWEEIFAVQRTGNKLASEIKNSPESIRNSQ